MAAELIRVDHSPADVLRAIKARAGIWRESEVPSDLAREGLQGIEVRIDGDTFTLHPMPTHRDPPLSEFIVRGRVSADSQGTFVEAQVGVASGGRTAVALLVVFALLSARSNPWIAAGLAIAAVAIEFGRQARTRAVRTNPPALVRYQLALVREAVAQCGEIRVGAG